MDVDLIVSSAYSPSYKPRYLRILSKSSRDFLKHHPEIYHTIMSNELQALRQHSNKFLINQARDRNALEGSISGFDLVERARLALLYELFA